MKCPNCGGALEIGLDITNFTCGYCGSEQFVERKGGVVQLKLLEETVTEIRADTSRVADELEVARLKKELESLEQKFEQERVNIGKVELKRDAKDIIRAIFGLFIMIVFFFFFANVLDNAQSPEPIIFLFIFFFVVAVVFKSIGKLISDSNISKEYHEKQKVTLEETKDRYNKYMAEIKRAQTALDEKLKKLNNS